MASLNDKLYIWIINGCVYTNIKPNYAKIKHNWDGKPDAQMTIQEFQERGGMVRLINGELFYGLTDEEKKQAKISELEGEVKSDKQELEDTDYVTIKIAEGVATKEEYEEVLREREELREEIRRLQKEIDELKGNSSPDKEQEPKVEEPVKEEDDEKDSENENTGSVDVDDIEPGDDIGGEEDDDEKKSNSSELF